MYRYGWMLSLFVLVALIISACVPVQPPVAQAEEDFEAMINDIWATYSETLNSGDVDGWVAQWTDDGVQMPPGQPPVLGKEAILERRAAGAERFTYDMTINNLEQEASGDLAFARGLYQATVIPKEGGDAIEVDGKYMTILKRQPDGTWKIYRDIFNSNVSPPPPSEPDIEAFWTEYAESIMAGDADRWIQLWMEDGVQLPPNAPPNVGRETIYAGIAAELEQLTYEDFVIENEDLMVSGDQAVARGMYSLNVIPKAGGDPIPVDGKYMSVLKRQPDGSWKLYRDIFNSNVPPSAPQEDMEAVINHIWSEYQEANMAGDSDRWIALWDENGVKLSAGEPPVVGKEAIYARKVASNERNAAFDVVMKITNEEFEVAGDWAFARGTYTYERTPKEGGNTDFFEGKFMTILKKQPDGTWKLYRDFAD